MTSQNATSTNVLSRDARFQQCFLDPLLTDLSTPFLKKGTATNSSKRIVFNPISHYCDFFFHLQHAQQFLLVSAHLINLKQQHSTVQRAGPRTYCLHTPTINSFDVSIFSASTTSFQHCATLARPPCSLRYSRQPPKSYVSS
jgi:hypothetical protein